MNIVEPSPCSAYAQPEDREWDYVDDVFGKQSALAQARNRAQVQRRIFSPRGPMADGECSYKGLDALKRTHTPVCRVSKAQWIYGESTRGLRDFSVSSVSCRVLLRLFSLSRSLSVSFSLPLSSSHSHSLSFSLSVSQSLAVSPNLDSPAFCPYPSAFSYIYTLLSLVHSIRTTPRHLNLHGSRKSAHRLS